MKKDRVQSHICMTNGLLIYCEKFAYFLMYWEALPHISHLNFLIYEDNLYQCNRQNGKNKIRNVAGTEIAQRNED